MSMPLDLAAATTSRRSAAVTRQSLRASVAHACFLFTGGKTCIDCHNGIAHRLSDMRNVL
ncbi:MAG: NapC/NirT family cytochrome c [Alphaproteobacteria bacterium]|nr:NapC/NirT family cytochrome c [Alphaproteobacteria bacterium]